MVIKKGKAKKVEKVTKKNKKVVVEEEEDENAGGASLADAFGDDEDVEYAESKPKKAKKKEDLDEELEEAEEDLEGMEKAANGGVEQGEISVKDSKPVEKIKKGDRIKIDGKEYLVDAHYVLIDHGTTKEMAIELYDSNEKDYQLRYFSDQAKTTLEFYELQEIMFIKKVIKKVEW